jgi:opacity protein-like surface antigen
MRRIILVLLILCGLSHAVFIDATIQDSRIVDENHIYKPEGIVGTAFEVGFFNEAENIIDYTLALGIRRFGYSYNGGDKTVVTWAIELKPLIWSITLWNISFEANFGIMKTFAGHHYLEDGDGINLDHGFRLGYRINSQFTANISYTEQNPLEASLRLFTLGGWGLNIQYNLPW